MINATPYSNAYRATLDDDGDIEALEAQYRPVKVEESEPSEQPAEPTVTNAEEETFKKRYADLQRYHSHKTNELKQQLEREAARVRELEQAQTTVKFPKTDEEIEEFKQTAPDVYGVIETIAKKIAIDMTKDVEVVKQRVAQREEEAAYKEALLKLQEAVPDFEEIRKDPAFHAWVMDQDAKTQWALTENRTDAKAAINAIKAYKFDMKEAKKPGKAKADLDTTRGAPRSSLASPTVHDDKPRYKESDIAKLTPQQYAKHEDEIELARREGRIIFDLSGGSR